MLGYRKQLKENQMVAPVLLAWSDKTTGTEPLILTPRQGSLLWGHRPQEAPLLSTQTGKETET
jgi:hypothetical protein